MRRPPCKVVLLGSTGFIGSNLLARFRQMEGLSVRGFDSSALDLTQPQAWQRLSEEVDPDTVLIVAARPRRPTKTFDYLLEETAIAVNVGRCLAKQKIRKCVYLSTTAVYGDEKTNLNIHEKTLPQPTNLYGLSKYVSEKILIQAALEKANELLILRPCMIYGSWATGEAYGPGKFVREIHTDKKIQVFGDGSERRHFLYIDDMAEITLRLALGGETGIYNVAGPKGHSFKDIIRLLRKIVNERFEIRRVTRDRPKSSQGIKTVKLRRALPRFRFTSLEDGLKKVNLSTPSPIPC